MTHTYILTAVPGQPNVFASMSPKLLRIAQQAATSGKNNPDDTLVAIVFAAFAAEAWLNELLHEIRVQTAFDLVGELHDLRRLIGPARLEERATSTITKYDVIGTTLAKDRWSRGVQPFQDFDLLLDIRNAIAHQRPEALTIHAVETDLGTRNLEQRELDRLVERLVGRGLVPRLDSGVVTSAFHVFQHPTVGPWAYETVCRFVVAMRDLMPDRWWRELVVSGICSVWAPHQGVFSSDLPNNMKVSG